jgi:hypothetical protein
MSIVKSTLSYETAGQIVNAPITRTIADYPFGNIALIEHYVPDPFNVYGAPLHFYTITLNGEEKIRHWDLIPAVDAYNNSVQTFVDCFTNS